MKKGIFFVSGILIGIGLTLGVTRLRSVNQGEHATVRQNLSRDAHASSPRAELEANVVAVKADELMAIIDRLQRWSEGKESSLKSEKVLAMLEAWSAVDAHAALAFVSNAPRFPRRDEAIVIPLAALCCREPKTVIEWIQQNITDTDARSQIANSIIERIKDKAPAAGLELAFAPDIPVEGNSFGELMGLLARTQPQVAVEQLARMAPNEQGTAVEPMLSSWAETNPEEALTWFLSQQGKYSEAAESLIAGCMKSGRCRIGNLIRQLGLDPEQVDGVLVQLSNEGVCVDMNEMGVLSPEKRLNAARILAFKLESDPDRILSTVKATMPPDQLADSIYSGWSTWLESDRKAALDWMQQQPDRQLADELNRRFQQNELAKNPVKALAALSTISDPEQRKTFATEALERLCGEKPEAAVAWLSQNQSEPVGAEVFASVTDSFLRNDEAAAMDWIAKLANGEAKDAALRAAADYWGDREIGFATASMAAIADPGKRQVCMFDLYQQLNRQDAVTAEHWLEQQGVPTEVRQSWKALANRWR